jgi:hypothetical protein
LLLGLKSYFLLGASTLAPQARPRPPIGPSNATAASTRPGGQGLAQAGVGGGGGVYILKPRGDDNRQ